MGFYDDPQVDDASKRSDESVTALMALFSQDNGFICRSLVPDKGTDFLVELVTEGRNARNWHFVVQLKSVKALEFVNNGEQITYTFRTSRLGYLSRYVPNLGMVVVYDYSTKECYFDFVFSITKRLFEERGSSEWEMQDTVDIHIPVANKLDGAVVPEIHKELAFAFKNVTRMFDAFGGRYGLHPTGTQYAEDDFDLNSAQGISVYLLKHGVDLLIGYELGTVSRLIGRLTQQDIEEHTVILCLAAVIRSEAGRFEESNILSRKALRRKDLNVDQEVLVRFADIKNRFKLGEIKLEEAAREMDALREKPLSAQSKLTLSIASLQAVLGSARFVDEVPDTYRERIYELFDEIAGSDLPGRTKFLFGLWNADNLSLFINLTFTVKARTALQGTYDDWVRSMLRILGLDRELLDYIGAIGKAVEGQSGKLVRAFTLQIEVKHLLIREIDSSLFKPELNNFAGFQKNLQGWINLGLTAFNYFNEEGLVYEAYVALCNALEFLEIGRFKLGRVLYHDIDALYEVKRNLEDDMLLDPVEMQVPGIFERAGLKAVKEGEVVEDFTDEQVRALRDLLIRQNSLLPHQTGNLIGEINGYQEAFRRIPAEKVGIRSVYYPVANVPNYNHAVRFVLFMKTIDLESAANYDVDHLLRDWGY